MQLDGALITRDDGSRQVRFTRDFDRPPTKVWAALTQPALLSAWLADVAIEPRVGGKFIIGWPGAALATAGKITVFEPERTLEYTWREHHATESVVRWELASTSTGCRLVLTHTSPPATAANEALGWLGGWHVALDNLQQGAPQTGDGESMWREIDARYREKFTGAPTPDERGESRAAGTVTFVRILPGPIERVWDHLTKPALLPGWFGEESAIEPRAGGGVRLMGGHIRGVVTQWRPPLLLAYTWNVFDPADGPDAFSAFPESLLTFALEAQGKQSVMLTLSHGPVLTRFEKQNAMGWHTMLDILGATLRGEKVEPRPAYMQKNAALYGVDMNNLAR